MTTRPFAVGLAGLGAATALTGALVVAATGSTDGDAADRAATTNAVSPMAHIRHMAGFYATHPGGRSGSPDVQRSAYCVYTADATEHWIRATGHLPCEPYGGPK